MRQRTLRRVLTLPFLAVLAAAPLRGQAPTKDDVTQRVAELKQAVAANKAKLQQYQWLETSNVSVKGETKKEQDQMCHYGPDGKVVKTPVGDTPSAPPKQMPTRGVKGRIVAKKVDEMKDYTDRVKSLISHYVPPDPEAIQSTVQAGNVSLDKSGGATAIVFSNYYKQGDKVTIGFDPVAKKLQSYNVATYLDDPVKDVITMTNQFASLPDGTNYLQQTVIDMKAKQIQITNTNSGYSKVN